MNAFGRYFFNFIGGTSRWVFGGIWRTIVRKEKFKFKEYLDGPENPDYYDMMGHQFNNRIIGALVFCFIIVPLIRIIFSFWL